MVATVRRLTVLVKIVYYSRHAFRPHREQLLLQETVRGFVAGECPPPRLRELFDAGAGHDPALWKGLAEMGVAGSPCPERSAAPASACSSSRS
jgi:xanthine/CO dehydrogenase XdhC/CoxF family maturation factor